MDGYFVLALLVLVIIVISIIAIVLLIGWIAKSFINKKFYLAIALLLITIPSFSLYFYKHTKQSVIKDFEEAAEVEVPKTHKTIEEDDSFMLIIDQMVHIVLQLDRASTNQLIRDIPKKNNNWIQIEKGHYLFSTKNKNGSFLVGLDSIGRTLSIQKNWSLFD